MKLTDDEREFLEIVDKAMRENNTDAIISIYATLGAILEEQGTPQSIPPIMRFTRAQYKRAIKMLRLAQAWEMHNNNPDAAERYDRAIQYIRGYCLQRMTAA